MSLINDALKRAKAAQQQAPPPAAPQFRPVESAVPNNRSRGPLVIGTIAALVLVVGLLAWRLMQNQQPAGQLEVRPQTQTTAESQIQKTVAPSKAQVATTATAHPAQPGVTPAPAPVPEVTQSSTPVSPRVDSHLAGTQPTAHEDARLNAPSEVAPATQAPLVAPAVVEPPKPSPPRLQAIVFHPSRPSAMISGKTLFVGDKFGQWRVVAINQESATLVGAGQTNVLSLPQ